MDGVNVKDYSHQELNNKVGYIPQKAVLFSGTIRSNMEFGESSQGKLEDEAIWKALELAQAKEFVAAKEKGLDTEVAQGGSNFSGDNVNVWPLRVPLHVSPRSSSLMIPSQPWITKRIVSCAKP